MRVTRLPGKEFLISVILDVATPYEPDSTGDTSMPVEVIFKAYFPTYGEKVAILTSLSITHVETRQTETLSPSVMDEVFRAASEFVSEN